MSMKKKENVAIIPFGFVTNNINNSNETQNRLVSTEADFLQKSFMFVIIGRGCLSATLVRHLSSTILVSCPI